MGRLFGTDGVRGAANTELTPELAFRLGKAAGIWFKKADGRQPEILIGRDTRLSGQMLEAALAAGICSAGGNAVLAGILPTPAIAYLTSNNDFDAGVVISASHNPFGDNGIKFFAHDGRKLPDSVEDEIAAIALADDNAASRPAGAEVGRIRPVEDNLLASYVDHVVAAAGTKLCGLKVVLDCANGAAYEVAPAVLRRLGAAVTVLCDEPDGININAGCGSTHLDKLQRAVVELGADVGVAHDGDADRCLMVDGRGQVIDGDVIMAICAAELKKKGKLVDDTLVVTVMSNLGLHVAMRNIGVRCDVTAVGDRYVLESMINNGYVLGGEQSGHVIFADFATTGDGLITATQVLAAMQKTNRTLANLASIMTVFPQVLVNVRVKSKDGWETNAAIRQAIAEAEAKLGDTGRILVRPSGTEPLIRVMAEGPDQGELDALAAAVAAVVVQELGN